MRQDDEMLTMLDRYGADISAWPQAWRTQAQERAARDPQFLDNLSAQQRIQQVLRQLPDTPVPAELWTKLFALPKRQAQLSLAVLWMMLGRFGRVGSAAGLASALLFGVWLGTAFPTESDASVDDTIEISDFGLL